MLAVRWLFPGTEIRIDSRCLDCGQPILIRMRDEDILEVSPETTVGHMNIPFAKILTGEVPWGLA
ncbi:MAG: alkylmercury lyase family protein [Syntrophales bacterium LBB04]|nr:alkylmercury lyase family protein [Syntrophales bacterium LBB04]